MTQEYPKMLYVGDSEQYSCRAVQDSEEEQQYRDMGFMDYVDLPNPEPEVEEVATGETPQGFVTTEQFDAVAERLAAAETEIERLKQASAPTTNDGVVNTNAVDYSNLSRDELRALIVEQGKSYKQNDTISQLIAILEGTNV
ncbi:MULTISPECIES: hypothetical protein [unclassified Acinetobacter]|uniref:hypothetical protein n=1 Tax=unclassified Acinetobacter TaxID=196816 RepID=UPI0015D36DB5|nr:MULTISPECIES: hypothetical protein [unclassified Acinetobacter]